MYFFDLQRDFVELDFGNQGHAGDAEDFRGRCAVAARVLEHALDVFLFDLSD